jgi:hypothetical protein
LATSTFRPRTTPTGTSRTIAPNTSSGHVPELIETGIVGALFGAGNAGNTTNTDAKHDGVTNPPSSCTTDGVSTGQICNDHPSTVADDDGGFIRMAAQAYYQSPVALTSGAPAAPVPEAPGPDAPPVSDAPLDVVLQDSGS